jgi:hypothetical protein
MPLDGSAALRRWREQPQVFVRELFGVEAASGLDINTGTPRQVIASENEIGQLNTATTAQSAALNVYGYKQQATNFGASPIRRQLPAR